VTIPLDLASAVTTADTDAGPATTVAAEDTKPGNCGATAGPVIVGLDLSLTRTGIATRHGADSIQTPEQLKGFARMRWIRARVNEWTNHADLVVVERVAYNSNTAHAKENAGLWHVVMIAIDARGIPWVDVASATRCKYATGNGRADKGQVLAAAIKRLPVDVTNHDEADAAWLCAIGHDLYGAPLAAMPAVNRAALDTVRPHISDLSPATSPARDHTKE
jgi:Holliday junction resolvasome RuvABC endonuclease subunit